MKGSRGCLGLLVPSWVPRKEHLLTVLPSSQPSAGQVDAKNVSSLQVQARHSVHCPYPVLGRLMGLLGFPRTPCGVHFRLPVA